VTPNEPGEEGGDTGGTRIKEGLRKERNRKNDPTKRNK